MSKKPLVAVAALLLGAPGAMGCGGMLCTLIGCVNGFALFVDGDLPTEYTVLMDTDGEPPTEYTYTCSTSSCYRVFVTEGSAPPTVHVTVLDATGGELARETYQPSYETSYPNGKACGPECSTATDTLTVG